MRIVIVGPGALGSLLTARISLFLDKQRVDEGYNGLTELYLLDHRVERARQLRESGLLYEEEGQSIHCAVQVETDPAVCTGCDVLFLCVKSMAVHLSLEQIVPYLDPSAIVVAMQNGIGHLDDIAALPCVSGVGVTSEGATLVSPGHVRHGGSGVTRIGVLGTADDPAESRLQEVAQLFNASGLHALVTGDPLKHVWAKLFINVAINALTAIHRCRNGDLLAYQATRNIMEKAVREAVEVARALGVPVEGDPVALAYRVCESTAKNESSMFQDVKNRRSTEIDAINGAVVDQGKRLGISIPVNADLVYQIKRIELSYAH